MNWIPDDLKHPSGGERIDRASHEAIRLAHRVLDRFPGLVKQHTYVAGGAAVSSVLVLLAGVAISRRMHGGQSAEQAVAEMTEEELSVHVVQPRSRSNGARFAATEAANGAEATNGAAPPKATVDAEDAEAASRSA